MKKTGIKFVAGMLSALLLSTPVYALEAETRVGFKTGETAASGLPEAVVPSDITEEERAYTHIGLYEILPTDDGAELSMDTFALYSYNTANADVSYAFLRGECGLNAAQAAGVMASLYTESHFEPTAYNGADSGGTVSYGICQWNSGGGDGGRYQMLINWCNANGYDYKSLNGQLNYIKYEINDTWEKQVKTRTDSEGNCFGTAPDSSDGAWIAGYTWSRYYGRGASSGWYSRGDVAREFYTMYAGKNVPTVNSDKVTAFVTRLYNVCLGRTPDEGGLQNWVSQLTNRSITGIQAAAGFIFSNEFKKKNYSNEDYVKQLYRGFMGREYDAGGLDYWIGKLKSGSSREAVFNGFALSKEFGTICNDYGIEIGAAIDSTAADAAARTAAITEFVTRMYQVCLGREPETIGLTYWVDVLRTNRGNGRSVAYGFVFSKEFIGKNYSDADYVEHLYNAFFGRGADATGKAYWLGKLAAGASRESVFDGFVGSNEFGKLCANYGIDRG